MSSNYVERYKKISEINTRLNQCVQMLEMIKPDEKTKYSNPQYRMWSGNIEDLENFVNRLEEWINEPLVAEAKRYLSELKKWVKDDVLLDDIEKEWRFLSENVNEIKEIYNLIKEIEYDVIRSKVSSWVLERIIEKDIERAKNQSKKANNFSNYLKQFESKEVKSDLAKEVKREAVNNLLKTEDSHYEQSEIDDYVRLVDEAERIAENKPEEIDEEVIIKTYKQRTNRIEDKLDFLGSTIDKIKDKLIELEWVEKFSNFEDYEEIYEEKQKAFRKDTLEKLSKALDGVIEKANEWKQSKKEEINNAFLRAERMIKNVGKKGLKERLKALNEKIDNINWDKPNVSVLHEVISELKALKSEARGELVRKLQNEDAILIIEEPSIVRDLGKGKGWDIDRFLAAFEVLLRNGLIMIKEIEV